MSASRVAVIRCDTCGAIYLGDSLSIPVARQRAELESGWSCPPGDGDTCCCCATPSLPGMETPPSTSVALPPGHTLDIRSPA